MRIEIPVGPNGAQHPLYTASVRQFQGDSELHIRFLWKTSGRRFALNQDININWSVSLTKEIDMTTPKKRMTKEDVKTLTDKLQNLPMKEKDEFSAREYVQMNKNEIQLAINKKGYGYQDIVDLLAEHDVQISASTLTAYLRTTPPKTPNTRGARKTSSAAEKPRGIVTDAGKSSNTQQGLKPAPEETEPYEALLASLDDDDAQSA